MHFAIRRLLGCLLLCLSGCVLPPSMPSLPSTDKFLANPIFSLENEPELGSERPAAYHLIVDGCGCGECIEACLIRPDRSLLENVIDTTEGRYDIREHSVWIARRPWYSPKAPKRWREASPYDRLESGDRVFVTEDGWVTMGTESSPKWIVCFRQGKVEFPLNANAKPGEPDFLPHRLRVVTDGMVVVPDDIHLDKRFLIKGEPAPPNRVSYN